jgi:hypothetical protein
MRIGILHHSAVIRLNACIRFQVVASYVYAYAPYPWVAPVLALLPWYLT